MYRQCDLFGITVRLYSRGNRMIGWQEFAPAEWRKVIYKFCYITQNDIERDVRNVRLFWYKCSGF